jgi:hypothetical protein
VLSLSLSLWREESEKETNEYDLHYSATSTFPPSSRLVRLYCFSAASFSFAASFAA